MSSIVIQLSKNIFGDIKWFEKRNIYESMTPIYYMTRFYGFAPFQLGTNDPHLTIIDSFLVTLNFICYLFLIYVQIYFESAYQHRVLCVDLGIKVLYFATSCVSLTTLIGILLNRNRIREIFDQLNQIDVEVIFSTPLIRYYNFRFQFKSYGIEVSHRKHYIVLSLYVTVTLFMQFVLFLFILSDYYYYFTDHQGITNFTTYLFVFIYNIGGYVAVLSYYCFAIMAITCRIILLNECLR